MGWMSLRVSDASVHNSNYDNLFNVTVNFLSSVNLFIVSVNFISSENLFIVNVHFLSSVNLLTAAW